MFVSVLLSDLVVPRVLLLTVGYIAYDDDGGGPVMVPQVWYGVPASAAAALDAAMRDALPHLFQRDKLLLHKLVTMLSPAQLVARGVPVCRAVQTPGSFIVTFPDAYHAGFNSGFNVAEAVNFAAPNWLPYGSSSVVRYRCARVRVCVYVGVCLGAASHMKQTVVFVTVVEAPAL